MPVRQLVVELKNLGKSTYAVLVLAQLVTEGILASGGTCAERSIGVLGDILVGLL